MKTYTFEVTTKVALDVEGENEEEARSKITDYLAEYFAHSGTLVTKDEVENVSTVSPTHWRISCTITAR